MVYDYCRHLRDGQVTTSRHSTRFLEVGPEDGSPIVLIHGWPEISLTWRHQLAILGGLGFRAIAPDLRGCGGSTAYRTHAAYAQREIVQDMIELADGLRLDQAVWVGHDWGSAVAWNLASHHPDRCRAVASLCVPYRTLERGVDVMRGLVNRKVYPEPEFAYGQFEYIRFYHENFEAAQDVFEMDLAATFRVLLRSGDPTAAGTPFVTAFVRQRGGWFGPSIPPPSVPLDERVLSPDDLQAYVTAYEKTGFFGIDALYMNDADNVAYADASVAGGRLDMPVLFLGGLYDYVCDTERSDLTMPMRAACTNLTRQTLATGHWMQQEAPDAVSAALCRWLASEVVDAWPGAAFGGQG